MNINIFIQWHILRLGRLWLAKRLKRGDKPKNRLDRIAMDHDIAYSKAKNLQDKWKADDVMIKAIDRLPGKKTMTEKVVKKIMQAKKKTPIVICVCFFMSINKECAHNVCLVLIFFFFFFNFI